MIKGDYDFLKELASRNMCAKDSGVLEVAWSDQEDSYYLRCGVCEATDTLTRQLSIAKAGKQGDRQVMPFEFEGVPGHDLATGEVLSKEQMVALVDYARKYDLDPMRGHVCLMYGQPYFTIDAYLYHAMRTGVPYTLSSHPLTPEEKQCYMIEPDSHAWLAIVIFTGTNDSKSGIGVVTQDEITAKSTKNPHQLRSPIAAAHPWLMAQKRAEWQALRRAFPIGESGEG